MATCPLPNDNFFTRFQPKKPPPNTVKSPVREKSELFDRFFQKITKPLSKALPICTRKSLFPPRAERGHENTAKSPAKWRLFFPVFPKKVDQTPLEHLRGTFWNLAHPHRIALSGNRSWSRVKLPILLVKHLCKRCQGLAHFNIHLNHQVSWPLSSG